MRHDQVWWLLIMLYRGTLAGGRHLAHPRMVRFQLGDERKITDVRRHAT